MKDFAGNELEVGMKVAIVLPGYKHLVWGKIVKFNPKTISVEFQRYTWGTQRMDTVVREVNQVILPMNPELQDRLGAEWLRANLTS